MTWVSWIQNMEISLLHVGYVCVHLTLPRLSGPILMGAPRIGCPFISVSMYVVIQVIWVLVVNFHYSIDLALPLEFRYIVNLFQKCCCLGHGSH